MGNIRVALLWAMLSAAARSMLVNRGLAPIDLSNPPVLLSLKELESPPGLVQPIIEGGGSAYSQDSVKKIVELFANTPASANPVEDGTPDYLGLENDPLDELGVATEAIVDPDTLRTQVLKLEVEIAEIKKSSKDLNKKEAQLSKLKSKLQSATAKQSAAKKKEQNEKKKMVDKARKEALKAEEKNLQEQIDAIQKQVDQLKDEKKGIQKKMKGAGGSAESTSGSEMESSGASSGSASEGESTEA